MYLSTSNIMQVSKLLRGTRNDSYLPHKFGQFVAMFPNFSRQIFRNVNIGSSQEFGLGQNLFAISKMSKVDQNWSAASDLGTCQKSKYLKKKIRENYGSH